MEGEGEKTGTGSTKSRLQHLLEKASQMQPEDMLFRYHGLLYPSTLCSEESLRLYAKFEARPEDMCIASYPKCGFNWVYALFCGIATAVQGKAEEEKNNMAKKITLLEFSDAEGYEVLVVFRNPKDVAVSYYHFCQNNPLLPNPTSWDDFFKQYMMGEVAWGSYFDSALIWEKHIDDEDVMVITYEELKENLPGGVQKIADFFGHSLTEEQIQNIARKGTFQAMNDNSKETHSVLGKVFFRKGVIGDWKTLFTEEQSQEMDAKFVECLAGTKLAAKLNYNLYCKT
ncbi:sulfotransferase 6B1 isoform X2 [Narcine bancroftii]|uniref:sulfotransferase 6B1 isoform X2 n=1 Tax=Narcine bancroftii TaxID=1343680 RepID=UPI003831F381